MIDAIRLLIEDDPHMTYQEIECSLEISSKGMYSILRDYLNLRKVCAQWIPYQHINDQKQM